MPTYDYKCGKCNKKFEKFQSITSRPIADCPTCGTEASRSISSGGGVIFKGSGFYSTDNKKGDSAKKKNSKAAKSEAGEGCKSCPSAKSCTESAS